jgi:hypothetical protein
MPNARIFTFLPYFLNIFIIFLYFYSETLRGLFMKAKKGKRPVPPTDGSIKLSKAALWCLKHPNGIPVIINDMRAVMR